MTDIVQRLREKQADMAETIERLDTSEFDTGLMGQIRAEQHDLYREAADEIDRLRQWETCAREWLDKTEWVQEAAKTAPVSWLGKHRADIMRAEIDRLTRELAHEEQRVADMMADVDRIGRERDEARAERDALAKDAERYRWLRDPCSGAERVVMYGRGDYGRGLMTYTMLDEAIDAAIDAQIEQERSEQKEG